MILAHLFDDDDNLLGVWQFDHLPRVGETVVVRDLDNQPYEVVTVEHYPVPEGYDPSKDIIPLRNRTILRLRMNGLPR